MLGRKNARYSRIKVTISVAFIILSSVFITSCSSKEEYPKTGDIDYTVVSGADIPHELKKLIKDRKKNSFELSYSDGSYLYIVKGYGRHDTSGYNIKVADLYQSDKNIVFDTDITGPEDENKVTKKATYPYIVVKTEYISNSVIFK